MRGKTSSLSTRRKGLICYTTRKVSPSGTNRSYLAMRNDLQDKLIRMSSSQRSLGSTRKVSSKMLVNGKKVSTRIIRYILRKRRSSKTAFSCSTFLNSSTKQPDKSQTLSAKRSSTFVNTLRSQKILSSSTRIRSFEIHANSI